MHILHITLDLENGGTARALSNIILNDEKNEHSVICIKFAGNSYWKIKNKCKNIIHLKLENPVLDFLRLIKFALKIKPDVVQTWLYYCDLLGTLVSFVLGSKRLVWNVRCTLTNRKEFKSKTNLAIKICTFLSHFSPKYIIFCSKRSYLDHLKIGYAKNKLKVIENGVDTNKFFPSDSLRMNFREQFNLNDNELILGTFARYDVQKDHNTLFKALEIIKIKGLKFKCFLVGPDMNNSNTNLVKEIKKYNIEDEIFLFGSRSDINFLLNGIDFHILPSKSEGFPNITLEAMASGTPCISSNNSDSKEIIGESGWIFPVSNYEKLAECIEMAVCENINFRNRRCEKAIEIVKNRYSVNKMVQNYINLYQMK